MYHLRMLGGLELENQQRVVRGPATQRHRLALLALLAAENQSSIPRDKLIGLLWPERDDEHARNLLNQAVHALRRTLGEQAVVSHGDALRLDHESLPSDLATFRSAIGQGDAERVVEAYRGAFLDGFHLPDSQPFDLWAASERERLSVAYCEQLELVARRASESGDLQGSANWWRRLAGERPFSSRVCMGYMEALDAAGERVAAISHARVHAQLLAAELGAEPDAAVQALAEQLRNRGSTQRMPDSPVETDAATDAQEDSPRASVLPSHDDASPPSGEADSDTSGAVDAFSRTVISTVPKRRRWRGGIGLLNTVVLGAGVLLTAVLLTLLLRDRMVDDSASGSPLRRVAVLPVAMHGGSTSHNYFAGLVHDALIAELNKMDDLEVMSRQSVSRFTGSSASMAEIADALGVGALVEASVAVTGDAVRVAIALVQARPERTLWTGTFDGTTADVAGLQRRTSLAVGNAVHSQLALGRQPLELIVASEVRPSARDAYVAATFELSEQSRFANLDDSIRERRLLSAQEYLRAAVTLEPRWAEAHAKLAYVTFELGTLGWRSEARDSAFERARTIAQHALQLNPDDSEANSLFGLLLAWDEPYQSRAEWYLQRSMELSPTSASFERYGLFLMWMGRPEEAVPMFGRAIELAPLSERLQWHRLRAYDCAEEHEQAIRLARTHVSRFGTHVEKSMSGIESFIAHNLSWLGQHEAAIAHQRRAAAHNRHAVGQQANLAFMLARSGRIGEARALLAQLDSSGTPPGAAHLFAQLGDTARAMTVLTVAARRDPKLFRIRLRCTEAYRTLRGHAQMLELERELWPRMPVSPTPQLRTSSPR